MNIYQSSEQLKETAKRKLTGKYGLTIAILILVQMITFFADLFLGQLLPPLSLPLLLLHEMAFLIVSSILGVFGVGLTLYFLNIACDRPTALTDIFYGFQNQFNKTLTLSSIMALLSFVCSAIYRIPYYIGLFTGNADITFLTYPCMAAAIAVYIALYLRLVLVYYLLLDFPDYSVPDILLKSNALMKGHKGRLFYIGVSYIPLLILGFLTCMVGILWVIPYMRMTLTCFFLDLMNPAKQEHKGDTP